MASPEAEDEAVEESSAESEAYESTEKQKKKPLAKKKHECNSRLEELAKPRKWLLLGTWKCFGYLFDSERMQMLKEKVQEEFSMTPEETELYFNNLKKSKPPKIDMKALRRAIKKEKAQAKREAYLIFHKLLKKAIKYAYKHAPPLLVSPLLRIISDHVLEILSEIHKVEIPKRTDSDNLSKFLIAVSDWAAVLIANIYYEIEVEERIDAERVRQLEKIKSETSTEAKEIPPPSEVDSEIQVKSTVYDKTEKDAVEEEEEKEGGEKEDEMELDDV